MTVKGKGYFIIVYHFKICFVWSIAWTGETVNMDEFFSFFLRLFYTKLQTQDALRFVAKEPRAELIIILPFQRKANHHPNFWES